MIVGTEWLIEAEECNENLLRDEAILRAVFSRIINELGLKTINEPLWHKFGGEGGVTGLVMLAESHLACHTYPEHKTATFNLYCCRTRPEWNWEANLKEMLDAKIINVQKIERGKRNASVPLAVGGASRSPVSISETSSLFKENNAPTGSQRYSRRDDGVTKKFVNYGQVKIRNRGRLPHWIKENGIYFVTFRLADSLPQGVLKNLKAEREQSEKNITNLERELTFSEKQKLDWLFSEKVDEYLDKNYGECHLRKSEIAEIVVESLNHFDEDRYHLFSWCVMPNHVHVVFRAIQKNGLDEILHSWKSYTAKKINRILGAEGSFWQREYYDHLVRDEADFDRVIRYTLNNPAKASLKNWQWVWAYGKYSEVAKP
jgi:S-adenosylmethionine decarboxylase proenzyme